MTNPHKDFLDKNLIDEKQFEYIDAIASKKVVSLFYELRTLLYLGIMLFTSGVGYMVYENLGDIGHISLMLLLVACIGAGFYYISIKTKPYSNDEVQVDHFYFDYVVVLVSLLIISLLTYVMVYFEWVDILLEWTSLLTGVLFLFIAYRYDNRMVLSMGVVALAAVAGLKISPTNWVSGEWFLQGVQLYVTSIVFGVTLSAGAQFLHHRNIKKHFTFTYQNFGILMTYVGGLGLVFDSSFEVIAAFVLLALSGFVGWYAWNRKLFLFFIYSCFCGYITFTFLLFQIDVDEILWIYYLPASFITGVVLLVMNRKHFSDD